MSKVVFFTGAGISVESGIPSFRGDNGLWEDHKIEEVATPEGWKKNREHVLDFYNTRRQKVAEKEPNAAHLAIAALERAGHNVTVITQNIDNLHEKAGSTNVIHMHGNIFESRSSLDSDLVYPCEKDIMLGDKCEKGSQLRPNVVWFRENVMHLENVMRECYYADHVIVVGTSLKVSPANMVFEWSRNAKRYIVDPEIEFPDLKKDAGIECVEKIATLGVPEVLKMI